MGRLVALILGAAALVLFVPPFLPGEVGNELQTFLSDVLGEELRQKIQTSGAGILAGLALLLLAVRGRD